MSDWTDLHAVDHLCTLNFFTERLQDISDERVDQLELFYNASILAHYSLVSTGSSTELPTPASLTQVFDESVANPNIRHDGYRLEIAGTQCLLLCGFFADQMRGLYNLDWYAKLGAGFFIRSAHFEPSRAKARLLYQISKKFEPWRRRYVRLARELRDEPYLLKPS